MEIPAAAHAQPRHRLPNTTLRRVNRAAAGSSGHMSAPVGAGDGADVAAGAYGSATGGASVGAGVGAVCKRCRAGMMKPRLDGLSGPASPAK